MTEDEVAKTYQSLRDSLTIVEDMLIVAKQGLELNPTPDERRRLDLQILDLEEQRARIDAKMIAILASSTATAMPSEEQIKEIARLSGEVEQMTNANATASAAISLGAGVLEFASGIGFG